MRPRCLASFTRHRAFKMHHVAPCISNLSFLMVEYHSTVRIEHILFTRSSGEGHGACFRVVATLNHTAIKTHAQALCACRFSVLLVFT